ncbi:DUF4097 family beta strand repeat-containing protein [Sphaerobacter thermophilus]|uniref:DUF4097 domain-containing protein n=1 Tax=Sphaerobacter thermophilus (strain ATCC 49802 / DSM 20745 / KCCM 41009 / NCIMB 13125 / S 6022) TaxID=479434 RepID=D1C6E7_SPHTD|nr:DUF4097 family beta strand repeat-containing protein [Sphaerobacter thermophilus]ACZ39572.1 hypothetical protein Sthe_2146 [Sphaerobacter thermophilus DSM 20745]
MSTSEHRIAASGVDVLLIEGTEGDLRVTWTERDDILVRGDYVEIEHDDDRVEISWQSATVANALTSILGIGTGSPVTVELPQTIRRTEITLRTGDLVLDSPRGTVQARVDRGDTIVDGGDGEIEMKLGGGTIRVERFTGPVTASSGAGDVKLTNVTGKVVVSAGAGDVLVQGGTGPVNLKLGAGDAVVDERDCDNLTIKLGTGDAIVRSGTSATTSIHNGLGDIVCRTVLGLGEHSFTTGSGDITVAVQRDIRARIEVITARGKIDSEIPLVSVGKRGPKSVLGRRLVGSIGDGDDRAEIRIRAVRGDVDLRWLTGAGARSTTPVRPAAPPSPSTPEPPVPPTPPALPEAPAPPEGVEAADSDTDVILVGPPAAETPRTDESEFENYQRVILSELAAGTLTVAEAERLLDALAQRQQGQHTTA